ncbi:uncharacterized protein [Mytilus edulis]|uniref:uncharacterized protein n=1 Tax=Mytilus edulis TaxID=6550 RepID=UPI0039F0E593
MGGIETNPGPHPLSDDNDDHNISFESVSESNSIREMFSTSISFLHLNVQSLLPKLDLILAEYEDFDILSFTETWLNGNNSSDSVELLNYQKPFRKDRGPMKSGGGVIVYVKENIHSKRRDDLEVPGVEVIWIQLKINNKNVLYGTFYVPPKSNNEIWTKIESSIESAVNDVKCDRIVVTGDFNDNLLNGANSKIHNICTNYSLEQLIEDPTHFTEQSSSLIDIIITDNSDFVPYCGVGPPLLDQIRYHCPVMGFINAQKPACLSFKRKIWLYKQGDFDEYRRILTKTNWDRIFALNDVDKINSEISNRILDAAEISIPNRIVTIRKSDPAWLNNDLRKLIRKKNRLHSKAKRFNRPADWNKFRQNRNKVTTSIRQAREQYQNNLIQKLSNSNLSARTWWKTCNQISGIKPTHSGIPPLLKNDNLIFNDIDKANEFNNFFAMQTNIDDTEAVIPDLTVPDYTLSDITLKDSEVEDVLKILNPNKASGPDLISPILLKEAVSQLKFPLCKLFNLSLSNAIFPADWKKANVTPVFKNDTSIYLTVDTPENTAEILNGDLKKIHMWSSKWLVNFNSQKTETMIISRKSIKPSHPILKMNDTDLQEVSTHKHLDLS